MNKHTPGPWKSAGGGWIEGADGTDVVCYAGCGSHDAEWGDADLRLALSAPDLLLCLKVIVCHAEGLGLDVHLHLDEARAAIAKATGETP